MPKRKIELSEKEQGIIIRGLEKIVIEAEKLSISSARMNIGDAMKAAEAFKYEVEEIRDRILGKQKLI